MKHKKKIMILLLIVMVLVTTTTALAGAYRSSVKNFYVVSNGVSVERISCSMEYDWRLTDGKLRCTSPNKITCTATNLKPGWSAVAVSHSCSSPIYDVVGTAFSLWDVYYYGVYKGNADVFETSVQDTTPPNWSWSLQETVP